MKKIDSNGLYKIQKVVLYAFTFSLPLFQKLATLFLVLLTAISLLTLTKSKSFDYKPYLIPAALYVLMGISLLYSDSFELKYLENRASLIALPLVFLSLRIEGDIFKKCIKAFVFGCLVAIAACYANAIYNSLIWVNGKLIFEPVVHGDFSFFEAVVRDGNYFFSGFFSIFHDTIYFAIFLNTAIAGMLSFQLWKKKVWDVLALLLCTLVIFQLSSKVGIISCFLVFAIHLIYRAKTRVRRILIPVAVIFFGILFFQQNPRGKSMINKFKTEGLTIEANQRFGYTLRLMSWETSLELIRENPIFGVGVADAQNLLNDKYEKKGYNTPMQQELNSHNTFFQIYLECGILGFLSILMLLYYLIRTLSKKKNDALQFNGLFILIVLLAFPFESVLNRFSGIAFFMFFYGLLINHNQHVGQNS